MHGETTLVIAFDHPAFAGHFPGAPIVPGAMLLDAAVHAILSMARPAAAGARDGDGDGDGMRNPCRIGSAKFLSPVGPGETLTISHATAAAGSTRFEISSGGRIVAAGTLVLPSGT